MASGRGFSLVELLGAIALLGLLSAAVLSLTGSLLRGGQALASPIDNRDPWRQRLIALISRDLLHAQAVRASGMSASPGLVLEIEGLSALDVGTCQPRHRRVNVRYLLVDAEGKLATFIDERDPQPLWLVREQRTDNPVSAGVGDGPDAAAWREVVCHGLKRAHVLAVASPSAGQPAAQGQSRSRGVEQPGLGRYRLTLEWIDSQQPTTQRMLQVW